MNRFVRVNEKRERERIELRAFSRNSFVLKSIAHFVLFVAPATLANVLQHILHRVIHLMMMHFAVQISFVRSFGDAIILPFDCCCQQWHSRFVDDTITCRVFPSFDHRGKSDQSLAFSSFSANVSLDNFSVCVLFLRYRLINWHHIEVSKREIFVDQRRFNLEGENEAIKEPSD